MNTHLFYLVSFIVILIPVYACLIKFGEEDIKIHWRVVLAVAIVGLIYAATEGIAFSWKLWADNPKYTIDHRFLNTQLETYLLNFLVFGAIACSTVILMDRKQKKRKKRK